MVHEGMIMFRMAYGHMECMNGVLYEQCWFIDRRQ
jgi:hypothetical protein